MYPFDDLTSEEQEQHNSAVVAFLKQVYDASSTASAEQQARAVDAVRERLFGQNQSLQEYGPSPLHFVEREISQIRGGNQTMNSLVSLPKKSRRQRLGIVAAVALLTLVIGSTLLVFRYAAPHEGITAHPQQNGAVNKPGDQTPTASGDPRSKASALVAQFHREGADWGQAHLYHDSFNGHNYALDNAYMQAGLGGLLDTKLKEAHTTADFNAVIDEANNALFNLHMLEADYTDKTSYNHTHNSDQQLLGHYGLTQNQVIVVSLVEQSLRVYQDGVLVKAFHVTTGRQEMPSLPGAWNVVLRVSPTILKSAYPKSSPLWYPDTRVNYAIGYHLPGYLICDSWWRVNYGPGTQFPHHDSGGDESFAGNGSAGAVNLAEWDAAWLYAHTGWSTKIVIY